MTPTEVTLIKGAPDDGSWSQGMFFGDLLVILSGRSQEQLRVSRICQTDPRPYHNVIGVSGSEAEADVIRHLGQPDTVRVDEDGLAKRSFFDRYNIVIGFERARVTVICVGA
jgi:hypothetical protein